MNRSCSIILLVALALGSGVPLLLAAAVPQAPKVRPRAERVERDRTRDRQAERRARRSGETSAEVRRQQQRDRGFLERIERMSPETRDRVAELRERGEYDVASERPGFESQASFEYHHAKHVLEQREYARELTPREYLEQAQRMRDRTADGQTLLEGTRARDGIKSRFDRSTGEWANYNADGTIRTHFKPNTGERYFHADLAVQPRNAGN